MPDIDADMEKTSYGTFERFLYLFLIPVIFTAILTLVLLSVFDYDVMNSVLRAANKIPLVESVVPDPKTEELPPAASEGGEDIRTAAEEEPDVEELQQLLQEREAELEQLRTAHQEQQQYIEQLQQEMAALQEEKDQETISEEEYQQNINRLAGVYADMMPSRAARIMENLTTAERVLLLGEMKSDEQIRVLEKMDPQTAAETSILLKDAVPVKERQIQALQERLKVYTEQEETMPDALSNEDLGMTFAGMNAEDAAAILLQMRETNADKVIAILRAMNVQARSEILTEISAESGDIAAQITAQLGDS